MTRAFTYAGVGVDVAIEAQAAKLLYQAAKKTWANRKGRLGEVFVPDDTFSGLRYVDVGGLPKGTVLFGGSDGVATKAMVAEKLGKFDTLAFDLMAMVCDDAIIRGGEPVLLKSVLDVNSLGQDTTRLEYIRQLARGYAQAAKQAQVAIINGELAQLGTTFGSSKDFRVSWSADITWFAHKSRLISGKMVRPGMSLVAFREPGVRSNGLTLLRKALETGYGREWHAHPIGKTTLGRLVLRPSVMYTPLMLSLTGGYDLKQPVKAKILAAAHITGGGLPEKLGRMLQASGYGAHLSHLFPPGKVLQLAQTAGNITDREAYQTWNMGQGMVVVTTQPEKVIAQAANFAIKAQLIGEITTNKKLTMISRGQKHPGQVLEFEL